MGDTGLPTFGRLETLFKLLVKPVRISPLTTNNGEKVVSNE